MSCKR